MMSLRHNLLALRARLSAGARRNDEASALGRSQSVLHVEVRYSSVISR